MIAPSSPREPATPQLERHEYVLRAGAGKSDLSKLADAAGDQAAFDAIEPEHIKSQPLSGLSESEKVMAEVRHRVLQGKAAAAQDSSNSNQHSFCCLGEGRPGRVAQVLGSRFQNKPTTITLVTCSRSL